MPSFRLVEVTACSSFDEIVPVLWNSYENPRNSAMEFIYPIKDNESKEAVIEDSKQRIIASYKANPNSHWVQVVDIENDVVVGAAEWYICTNNETNPYAKDSYPPTELDWWPEGDTKKFTIMMFDISLAISRKRQQRPHIGLSLCFTDPKYRNHGAGAMMVDWGVKKADELGLECFCTATLMSQPLYEKAKFLTVDETVLDMNIPHPSEEWKARQAQLLPYSWYNMWRSVGGKHEKGAQYPWEG